MSSIARYTPVLLGIYLAIRIGDLTIREAWPYVTALSSQSIMFLIEITVGVILPIIILSNSRWRRSVPGLLTAASMVIAGVVLNRINVFLVAYQPLYSQGRYVPSILEILVTVGLIATLVLVYRVLVMIFPVISVPITGAARGVENVVASRADYQR